MTTAEVLKKVRRIELKTRRRSQQLFSGAFSSVLKGRGMSFSEVREYVPGDDVRTIDWNVTARFNAPYVKVYEEDRELNVVLLMDASKSTFFGSQHQDKHDVITELMALLAFSALQHRDTCSVMAYSNQLELYIPPLKGSNQILGLIHRLVQFKPRHSTTDMAAAIRELTRRIHRKSIVFIVSDFKCDSFLKELKILNQQHEVLALRITDPLEQKIPNLGILPIQNPETGEPIWVDTSSAAVRRFFELENTRFMQVTDQVFKQSGVRYLNISTTEPYWHTLSSFIRQS